MRPGQYAIHSLHAPPVEIWSVGDDGFTWGHNRNTPLRSGLGSALHVTDTREDAEAWQRDRIAAMSAAMEGN